MPALFSKTVYAIRHVPTGAFMPCRMFRSSQGGWSLWIPGTPPIGYGGLDGFDKNPRIFYTLQSARNALTAWLMGVHKRTTIDNSTYFNPGDVESIHVVEASDLPRVRAEMEIVTLTLKALP